MKTVLTSLVFIIIMLLPLFGKTQLVTISGNVTHSKSGKALENVTIFETSSNIGTITNENGFFTLVLLPGMLEIEISDNGFNGFSQQIVLKSDTTLTVQLQPEIQSKNRLKKQNVLQANAKTSKRITGQQRDR